MPVIEMPELARKAVVVGGGPVGCLTALSLARSGWRVELYDARKDPRLPSSRAVTAQRSINLAISSRGLAAIRAIDPDIVGRFLNSALPMRGRMIHLSGGGQHSQPYDIHGQCINSIDRGLLNEELMDEVERAAIAIFFEHKLQTANFDGKKLQFATPSGQQVTTEVEVNFDFCVGADGSHSNVRRQLMRVLRMDYQQQYIPDEYVELRIPAGAGGDGSPVFKMDPGYLHIWPRHSFMLIALPNKDCTFTATLFAPKNIFDCLETPREFGRWFDGQFPDALQLIGLQNFLHDVENNPRSPLIHIKANPYHYRDRAIVLGDAAHSMVPFFGQGLNCGLEDVRVLQILLRKHGVSPLGKGLGNFDPALSAALKEYSETRHEDLVAICDMAMQNYVEMRHSVTTPLYRLRKLFDGFLSRWSPFVPFSILSDQLVATTFVQGAARGWLPLYTMVTFRPDISYATVRRKAAEQTQFLTALGLGTAGGALLLVGMWVVSFWRGRQ